MDILPQIVKLNSTLALLQSRRWSPDKLFGPNPAKEYRRLAKTCHPDLFHGTHKTTAELAFTLLGGLYAELNNNHAATTSAAKLGAWVVTDPYAAGDICDLYRVTGTDAATTTGILKLARDPSDNDLLAREVQALKSMRESKLGDKYRKYIPGVIQSSQAGGRKFNVISDIPGAYTLLQLIATHDISDFRHWVWMFNRLLTVLGFAHRAGLIHGAVVPDHLLYLPADHGLVLIDWTAATGLKNGQKVPYVSPDYDALYPPEIKRHTFGEGTDIYMAAQCLTRYAPAPIPKPFRKLLDYCMAGSIHSRADDAWFIQQEWKARAEEAYGAPKFLELKPTTT